MLFQTALLVATNIGLFVSALLNRNGSRSLISIHLIAGVLANAIALVGYVMVSHSLRITERLDSANSSQNADVTPTNPFLEHGRILASRIFAGPTQYPPKEFAAYGIVAFKSLATSDDRQRYEMFCRAYVSSITFYKDLTHTPIKDQMVTVWPINNNEDAAQINERPFEESCPAAVSKYGLQISLGAIATVEDSGSSLEGAGPFLLAWSPSSEIGKKGAPVLVSDLTDVTKFEDAKDEFQTWAAEVQMNPKLWRGGWNVDELRAVIRRWANKFGPKFIQLFSEKK